MAAATITMGMAGARARRPKRCWTWRRLPPAKPRNTKSGNSTAQKSSQPCGSLRPSRSSSNWRYTSLLDLWSQ
ncbi:MAG: hypothetical protein QOD77_1117 [Thermoplasmata archaeon]|nr:hypothetical protein [Thermoplasmata archaeon]